MATQTIGIKELHANFPKITRATQRGQSFLVLKHARPVFRIEPTNLHPVHKKKGDLRNFLKIGFRSGEKHLSQRIDEILYGA